MCQPHALKAVHFQVIALAGHGVDWTVLAGEPSYLPILNLGATGSIVRARCNDGKDLRGGYLRKELCRPPRRKRGAISRREGEFTGTASVVEDSDLVTSVAALERSVRRFPSDPDSESSSFNRVSVSHVFVQGLEVVEKGKKGVNLRKRRRVPNGWRQTPSFLAHGMRAWTPHYQPEFILVRTFRYQAILNCESSAMMSFGSKIRRRAQTSPYQAIFVPFRTFNGASEAARALGRLTHYLPRGKFPFWEQHFPRSAGNPREVSAATAKAKTAIVAYYGAPGKPLRVNQNPIFNRIHGSDAGEARQELYFKLTLGFVLYVI
ncbi:hypothetical protein B0H12DRAFT_1075460 [Mycena haematopus]|nr:hypothetical protein B0H12DRAFT_1075460 [Mycena haematopus]